MTKYTTPHNLPVIEPITDNIKDSESVSALADDLNALSVATNNAMNSEGERLEEDATTKADAARWQKADPLPDSTNVNTFVTPGLYRVTGTGASTATGLPTTFAGMLEVLAPAGFSSYWTQRYYAYASENKAWFRTSSNTTGGWNPWQQVVTDKNDGGLAFSKGNPGIIDANTFYTPGVYRVSGSAATSSTNLPVNAPGVLKVMQGDVATWAEQEFTLYGSTPRRFWRISSNTTGGWNPWQEMGAPTPGGSGADAGLSNALLLDEWWGRVDGAMPTGGKAAVALRFDHGLTKMKSDVVSSLVFRGFKWGMALNSRNWDLPQNSGAAKQDVIDWCIQNGAEVWNHGATHGDRPDEAGIYDEIMNGLTELREALPGVPIDGYIPAGVGGTNLAGFNGGNTPAAYSGTYAGRLILSNHAIGAGYFTGSGNRLLDGKPKQGQGHYTMDTQSVANIKARIDNAIASKGGLQLMCHPDYLGDPARPTNITVADLIEVLSYLKAKQDAGDLVVLSPYELIRADARF